MLEIDRDGDDRLAHGVGRAIHLDLVDEVVELQGQVVGESAGFALG